MKRKHPESVTDAPKKKRIKKSPKKPEIPPQIHIDKSMDFEPQEVAITPPASPNNFSMENHIGLQSPGQHSRLNHKNLFLKEGDSFEDLVRRSEEIHTLKRGVDRNNIKPLVEWIRD
eukprot:TRINITY_DN3875_c0_g1_i2.p1 TRINITY_DN3875_c0_g1~~TRINITY_DN3875_c0_g1_i2.p1  ORF type:complete len:117 (-),score=27.14 TRINITY_DN3875_c0_g1_i2:63-413(-)